MAGRKRPERRFDIWPGFVDALSGLLIVFVIVSMIFMTAQFFLGEELVGRDRTIDRLMTQIATLTKELEDGQTRAEAAEGRASQAEKTIAELTAELQSVVSVRDRLAGEKAELENSLTGLRGRFSALEADRDALRGEIGVLQSDRQGMLVKLDTLEKDKKTLLLRIASLEAEADRLALQLAEAMKSGKAADARAPARQDGRDPDRGKAKPGGPSGRTGSREPAPRHPFGRRDRGPTARRNGVVVGRGEGGFASGGSDRPDRAFGL